MPEITQPAPGLILISKSEVVDYATYQSLDLDRLELYWNLVQMRMTYFEGGFRPFLEVLNRACFGRYWVDVNPAQRRGMFSIWNLPSLNGFLAATPLLVAGMKVTLIQNFDAELDRLGAAAAGEDHPWVGISTTFILNWSEVARLAKQVRIELPGAMLIVGGAFVHDQALQQGPAAFETVMRKLGIAFILFGFNSEEDLLALMRAHHGGDYSAIKNLAWMDSTGRFRTTPLTWTPPRLEGDSVSWQRLGLGGRSKVAQLRTSSGCAFRCAFCSYPITSRGYHTMELEALRQHLDSLAELGVEFLIFIDDTFNVPLERFRRILDLLKQYRFRWYSFFRVQFADEALVRDMLESGCDGVYLGLESANDKVLAAMDKKATVADYRRGLMLLKAAGIPTFAAFVLGFPGETQTTLDDNAAFIEQAAPDFYSLKEFYYLSTAPVHTRRHDFGLSGEGHEWRHATMDSFGASAAKTRLFGSIRGSVYVDSDTGLWLLAYLRSEGFGWEMIKRLLSTYNEMVRRDLAGRFKDKQDLFEVFRETAAQRRPC